MLISTQTDALGRRFGDKKTVDMITKAGFNAVDFSMFHCFDDEDGYMNKPNYEKELLEMRHIANENGACFNQAHAPFPSVIYNNEEYTKRTHNYIIRAIEAASILGAKNIIVHPFEMPENQKEKNIEFYNSLETYCKQYNIKVAVENMFGYDSKEGHIIKNVCSTGEELAEYVDCLNPEYFCACLDIGHAGLVGETASGMIKALGHDRLHALHVHDNNFLCDMHTLPFTCKIDWEGVTAALKSIKYDGDMTLEADLFILRMPDELVEDCLKLMAKVAGYLASRSV